MPYPVQAAFIQKIFAYDRLLEDKTDPAHLVLVGLPAADASALEVALRASGIRSSVVAVTELEGLPADVTAVYVRDADAAVAVGRFCRKRGALSLTDAPTLVERGLISVGLGVNDAGRPKIVINVVELAAESHVLDSRLLQLAQIHRTKP